MADTVPSSLPTSLLLGCCFETDRLLVQEFQPTFSRWQSAAESRDHEFDVASVVVASVLTEEVTKPLPPHWQGPYSPDRAKQWMCDLIDEPMTTLLFAVAKDCGTEDTERSGDQKDALKMASDSIVGLVIAFELAVEGSESQKDIRLGYLLSERFWGRGFASELVKGFVSWCREFNGTDTPQIASIIGGVARTNVASKRVLAKNGFQSVSSGGPSADGEDEPEEEEFQLQLIG